jgi:tetratricopeptide (TPR) repeat protein
MYAPSFGFALLVVGLGALLHARLRRVDARLAAVVLGTGSAAVIGGYAFLTHSYSAVWQSEDTLWTHVARCEPRSHKADNALGVQSFDRGDVEEALAHYGRAIEKGSPNAWFNRGNALASVGRHHDALRDFERAAEIHPRLTRVQLARGNSYMAIERFEEAVESYAQAIHLDPGDAEAYNNRGAALVRLGRLEAARPDYQKAIALDPTHAAAHHNLANVQLAQGDRDAALRNYEIAAGLGLAQAKDAIELLRER